MRYYYQEITYYRPPKKPSIAPLVGLALGALCGLCCGSLTNEGTPKVIWANVIFWGFIGMFYGLLMAWGNTKGDR